ncbi:MAG TPA: DUF4082 domain-containing protein [Blastocatellia bacterium]|nr:DUF4082 domain-containing protein [Blastocatellia bacterium]
MKQGFQRFAKQYFSVFGTLIGLVVVSSILLYSGCGMTSSPNTPASPTPTPTPTPDTLAPTSAITSPAPGATVLTGTTITISGTASDAGGGTVARVDVSVDGGATFSAATGTAAWSFTWTPATPGQATIRSRAVDNSGNVQDPPAQVSVTVQEMTPPTSTITFPNVGATVLTDHLVNITGTASDAGGGTVARVEVSVDGGVTWNVATGTTVWSYNWTPTMPGPATIKSRAGDNSGNQQNPPAEIVVIVAESGPTPPQVLSVTPTEGSIDVPVGIAPRAAFSKAIDPTSLTDSTVILQDSQANPVPINIAYDSIAHVVALAPRDLLRLRYTETYTATLKGGANEPHITDTTGLPLHADYSWTFTAAPQPPIPGISLFPSSIRPANLELNDPTPIEVGMKFRSDVDGLITGVRYYKGGPQSGSGHALHLWNNAGTQLFSATFNQEPNNVWMQALITPIPIQANTTYVVSYFAPQGHQVAEDGYFTSKGVDNGPLHGLQNGVDGPNGVYHFGESGFPTTASNATNYYVDVIFNDPTSSAPQVIWTLPATGQGNVWIGVKPSVTFSEAIDPASVSYSTVLLQDTANRMIPFTWALDTNGFTLTLTPTIPLTPGQVYTVTVKGGLAAPHITDTTGTPLAADYAWSFTTELPQ